MSESIVLEAHKREITGKKVKSLRANGFVPATVYENGKESINVQVAYNLLSKAYSHAGMGQPVELSVDNKKYLTMIKDVHIDPAKNTIMHVAFHAVNANDPVEAEVPVHIEGDVPAEQQGNFIVRPNSHVEVKALPANLPEFMSVDASKLVSPGDHVTVADINPIKDVEIISEPELVLATVEEPRAVVEAEAEEENVDASDVPSDNGGEKASESEKSE
jgi:large subunit ribosomal protein L25